jgi:site-specific recombinase XerD
MEILGHSTLAMTQRYTHVLNPMLDDAAARLDQVFTGIGRAV